MLLLKTDRLTLVDPQAINARQLYEYHHRNVAHFAQGGGTLPDTLDDCQRRLANEKRVWGLDMGYRYYGLLEGDPILDIGLSNIIRGAFQAAHLGYRTDKDYQGKGYMTEALSAVIGHAFDHLRLHRIMANYQPWNQASGHILKKLGFVEEGLAKDYLFIEGAWRDHVLTSLVNPHWMPHGDPNDLAAQTEGA